MMPEEVRNRKYQGWKEAVRLVPLCRPNCALHPTNWDIQPGTSNFQTRSRADGIALEKQPGTTAERSYAKDPVYEGSCVVYEAA